MTTLANRSNDLGAHPWVTVIIPTRDRPELAAEAVRSALVGNHASVVVVDDAEAPSWTAEALNDRTSPVTVVASRGQGPAGARNVGAELACTPWLVFLDDDDLLERHGLEEVRQALNLAVDNVGVVFAAVTIRNGRDGPAELRPPESLGPLFHSVRGQLVAGGFCVSREVFEAVAGYEPMLHFSENTELVLRVIDHCLRNDLAILTIEAPLGSIWRRTAKNRSSNGAFAIKHGAEFLLSRHAEGFARDPGMAANFHRVAGVNAARLRQRREAHHHFGLAFKLGRARMDLVRSFACRTPLLWRALWRSDSGVLGSPTGEAVGSGSAPR